MLEVTKEDLDFVKDTINAYRCRKKDCLEGTYDIEIEEKDWGSATKELQKEHISQRKRLVRRGFSIELGDIDISRIPFLGNIPILDKDRFFYDGKYPIGCCRKKVKRIIKFTHEQETVDEFPSKIRLHYYTSGEPGEEAKVSSEEVFYTREPFAERAEYWNAKRWLWGQIHMALVIGGYGLLLTMGIIGLGYSLVSAFMETSPSLAFRLHVVIIAIAAILAGISLKGVVKRYLMVYNKRKQSKEVLHAIQKVKPDFCMEKFISIADSRIKSIYYMEKADDVSAFVNFDLTEFYMLNEDVLHCETNSFWFDAFYRDEATQYMEIIHRVVLYEDAGGRIKRSQCMLKVRFARPLESIMSSDYYYDWCIDRLEVLK